MPRFSPGHFYFLSVNPLMHQHYRSFHFAVGAIIKQHIQIVSINTVWSGITFISSVPALGKIVAFKNFFAPAVKYLPFEKAHTGCEYLQFIVVAVTIGCKYIR